MTDETKGELGAGAVAAAVGAGAGAVTGKSMGIAAFGTAASGVIPLAVAGGLLLGLAAMLAWRHRHSSDD